MRFGPTQFDQIGIVTGCAKSKEQNGEEKGQQPECLKHGAYSRKDMLPGEKIRDFEALREALHAPADGQPAVVSENEPEPATQTKIAVSANSNAEKEAFRDQSPDVIEEIRIDEGGPASIPPDITEKEYLELERVKVEFFAKPVPATVDELVEELGRFCALCEEVMVSNAPSNPTSLPNATST